MEKVLIADWIGFFANEAKILTRKYLLLLKKTVFLRVKKRKKQELKIFKKNDN